MHGPLRLRWAPGANETERAERSLAFCRRLGECFGHPVPGTLALLVSITAAQTVNPICSHQGSPQSFLIKSYALSIQGENVKFITTET
jgi:hypothetical protein